MASSPSPLLIILGAGKNVGAGVASKFKQEGFQVALGSRNPHKEEGFHTFQVDLTQPASVSAALEGVEKHLGIRASVVVYNAAGYNRPLTLNDPLSMTLETFTSDVNITQYSAFAAAQHAIASFRALPAQQPKAFILTGNLSPFGYPSPGLPSLGVGKQGVAHLISLAAKTYGSQGYKFYFATLTSESGGIADYPTLFIGSGQVHGSVYFDLYKRAKQGNWDVRFTPSGKVLDTGKGDFEIFDTAVGKVFHDK